MKILPDRNSGLNSPPGPSPQVSRAGAWRTMLGWLGRKVSSLLVFVLLGSLLVWGHHTGWTMPKFSSLTGNTEDKEGGWCSDHNVPESQCVECNPDLLPKPKSFGWCKLHGVHECPFCHPEVAQVKGQPQVIAAALARAKRPELEQWPENNSKCMLHEHRIQFVSQEAVEKAGIEVETVGMAPVVESVTGNGEVTYDQTHMARLSARVPGSMFRVCKQVGDPVKAGEVIGLVDAAEVGRAKSEFLQALVEVRLKIKNFEALAPAAVSGAIPGRSLREGETALSEARIRLTAAQQALTNLGLPTQLESLEAVPEDQLADHLRFLGLPQTMTASFDSRTTGNLLPLTAPLDGVVVSRDVVAGEVVDARQSPICRGRYSNDVAEPRPAAGGCHRGSALGQEVRFWPDGGREASGPHHLDQHRGRPQDPHRQSPCVFGKWRRSSSGQCLWHRKSDSP